MSSSNTSQPQTLVNSTAMADLQSQLQTTIAAANGSLSQNAMHRALMAEFRVWLDSRFVAINTPPVAAPPAAAP